MARHSVNTPPGSIVIFEGREYAARTTLPERATEYSLIADVPTTAEERLLGVGNYLSVYVANIPIDARISEIRELIAQQRDIPVGSREWWEAYERYSDSQESDE